MAYNNNQQIPFWDFVRAFDLSGTGVDHAHPSRTFEGEPPFGPGPQPAQASGSHPPPPPPPGSFPWGGVHGPFGFPGGFGHHAFGGPGVHCRGGRRERHCRRDHSGDRSRSRAASPSGEEPEGEGPDGPAGEHRRHRGHGRHGRHDHSEGEEEHGHDGPRRGRGFGGRGRGHRGGWGHHGRRGSPAFGGPGGMGAFDLSALLNAFNNHPIGQQSWAQMLRQYAQQAGLAGDSQRSGETGIPEGFENTFTPPIDAFSTETAYILHIALPGAKKEDVGVNYDSDKGELNVAGVVYRQGDEEFLKSLSQSERKVGVFERTIKLPPANEEKEEVNGDGITAKLEDGVLVVTVPKVEKEWTEVKKVDIN
ncbi:hypothetical protein ONS95_006143 [Cadophora gregata]|uniref:uncharacterized protein n=1 Tax=Cadophora gregata TaxID=51156 RepID=UPI0026DDBBDF|nr:uncharacterized protein ONS95_006143 [Cadophora gregata]KAK0102530.1 hypothetical protein ONS95_006143 [Cadophora gregata]KAK0104155.1 hypothetical protein ONS96_005250 [Cadophora gregata f. sp. sojae]